MHITWNAKSNRLDRNKKLIKTNVCIRVILGGKGQQTWRFFSFSGAFVGMKQWRRFVSVVKIVFFSASFDKQWIHFSDITYRPFRLLCKVPSAVSSYWRQMFIGSYFRINTK